ncbi:MAG: hypothetical protein AB7F66_08485 [Bacteriovoracia bacterium]
MSFRTQLFVFVALSLAALAANADMNPWEPAPLVVSRAEFVKSRIAVQEEWKAGWTANCLKDKANTVEACDTRVKKTWQYAQLEDLNTELGNINDSLEIYDTYIAKAKAIVTEHADAECAEYLNRYKENDAKLAFFALVYNNLYFSKGSEGVQNVFATRNEHLRIRDNIKEILLKKGCPVPTNQGPASKIAGN